MLEVKICFLEDVGLGRWRGRKEVKGWKK